MSEPADSPSLVPRLLKFAAFGAVCGVLGYGLGWLLADHVPPGAFEGLGLGWSDYGALAVALMLIIGGGYTLFAARSAKALAAVMGAEDRVGQAETRQMRVQGAVVMLSGAMLAAPPLIVLAGNSAPAPTYAVLMAVFVLHTAMNLRLWRRGDEMIRRVIVEAGAGTFWIAQGLLFVWAVAERLGLAPAVTAWDLLVGVMGLYLIVSTAVAVRRGVQ